MAPQSPAWVIISSSICIFDFIQWDFHLIPHPRPVDLGGSLAVASKGLFATGVSTDLNGIFKILIGHGKRFSIKYPDDYKQSLTLLLAEILVIFYEL